MDPAFAKLPPLDGVRKAGVPHRETGAIFQVVDPKFDARDFAHIGVASPGEREMTRGFDREVLALDRPLRMFGPEERVGAPHPQIDFGALRPPLYEPVGLGEPCEKLLGGDALELAHKHRDLGW